MSRIKYNNEFMIDKFYCGVIYKNYANEIVISKTGILSQVRMMPSYDRVHELFKEKHPNLSNIFQPLYFAVFGCCMFNISVIGRVGTLDGIFDVRWRLLPLNESKGEYIGRLVINEI